MSLLPLIATRAPAPRVRTVKMPMPTVPPIQVADRVDLDVLVNPASTSVVRGATLTFPPAYRRRAPLSQPERWGYWGHAFWETWPVESWIAPTLDHMAAGGANVVAFKGGQAVVSRGLISWDEYLARWVDTISHAKALGLRCFICFSDPDVKGSYDATKGVLRDAALFKDWAQAVASTGNVIGMDVLNESWIGSFTTDVGGYAQLERLLNIAKDAKVPAAYDWYFGGQDHLKPQVTFPASLASQFDFWCFHRYQDVTTTQVQEWRTQNAALVGAATKRAIFGEYGANTVDPAATRKSRYSTMKALLEADTTMAGTLAFSWTDFVDQAHPSAPDEATTPYWGLHSVNADRSLTPRADVVDIWRTWPTRR